MPQRALRCALLAVVLVCHPLRLSAAPFVIDFETLNEGDDVGALLGLGVSFSHATVLTAGSLLNEIDFPPRSGANVIFDDGSPMRIDFTAPVSVFSGYFTYVAPLTINFFDAASTLLGSKASLFDNNTVGNAGFANELLSGSFSNIAYLTITGSSFGSSFTLDDVSFEPDVNTPEPNALALIGIGIGAFVRYRRKAAANAPRQ